MSERPDVLERNVELLLTRAFVPVAPRQAFRERVVRVVRGELARQSVRASAPWPRRLAWASALAAAFVAAFWLARAGGDPESLESLLASGRVGWRELPLGEWRAAQVGSRLSPASDIEVHTPSAGGIGLELSGAGRVQLEAAGNLAIRFDADFDANVHLSGGRLHMDVDEFPPSTRLTLGGQVLELSGGELEAAFLPGDACPRVSVLRGSVHWLVAGERRALDVGPARPLCPDLTAPRTSDVAGEDQRRSADLAEPTAVAAPVVAAPLSGRVVVDADGAPLDAFRVVCVYRFTPPDVVDPVAHEFEDAGGRFEVRELRPGMYVVWVQAQGFAAWHSEPLTLGSEPREIEARLVPGRTLSGRVVLASTGEPVAGASVVSESDAPTAMLGLSTVLHPAYLTAKATTDEAGRFELERVNAGPTWLRATAPGSAPTFLLERPGPGGEVSIELTSGATIFGQVELDGGEPAVGVQLVAAPMNFIDQPVAWFEFTQTDAQGHYSLADLPWTSIAVIRLPGPVLGGFESRYTDLFAGESKQIDFLARRPGQRFFGQASSSAGEPLAAHSLTLVPHGELEEDRTKWRVGQIGPEGAFEISGLADGRWEVFISCNLPMEVVHLDSLVLNGADVERALVTAEGEILGRVTDLASGTPISEGAVVLMRQGEGGELEFHGRVLLRGDGSFHLPYLEPGGYRLLAYATDAQHALRSSEWIWLSAGETRSEVELALDLGSSLELSVRDEAGASLSRAVVRLFDSSGAEFFVRDLQHTDGHGRLWLSSLPAGRLRVQVELEGYLAAVRNVELAPLERLALTVELLARR